MGARSHSKAWKRYKAQRAVMYARRRAARQAAAQRRDGTRTNWSMV